jgi:hypothetical protein
MDYLKLQRVFSEVFLCCTFLIGVTFFFPFLDGRTKASCDLAAIQASSTEDTELVWIHTAGPARSWNRGALP